MIVTTRDEARLRELVGHRGVHWARLGVVGGDRLALSAAGRTLLDLSVAEMHQAWMSLEGLLAQR